MAEQPAASVTAMVNVAGPAAVGVPLNCPAADSVSPAGSVPALTVNVNGAMPTGAVSAAL